MKNPLPLLLAPCILLIFASMAVLAQPGGPGGAAPVVITEIMYNPPESDNDSLEFLEIYNPNSSIAVDLSGYYFSDGIGYTFPQGISIDSAGFVLLAKDSVAFEGVFGMPAYQWTSMALLNTGEAITLRNASGIVVDTVDYNDANPWPTAANGQGASLVLCHPDSDNNDVTNWFSSQNSTGITVNNIMIWADPGALSNCPIVSFGDAETKNQGSKVYPNPSDGQFRVQIPESDDHGVVHMYDLFGRVVYWETWPAGTRETQIDVSLPEGIYLLSLETSNGILNHRVTVQR